MQNIVKSTILAVLVIALMVIMLAASPAFAAATCYDGTASESSGSGTCSHHGGVYEWIY